MAKRKAAAAVVGQRQLFPEALQHQRQLTMTVMVPAETARTIAAEQARRDRAKVKNPRGWVVIEETGRLGGRRWVFAKKADAMRQARAVAKASTPGHGAYVQDSYGKRSTFVGAKVPKRRVRRNSSPARSELVKRALYLQGRAEHADKVGDRMAAREYQEAAERVIAQINRLPKKNGAKKKASACACANPRRSKRTTKPKRTTRRAVANPRVRIELSPAESLRWEDDARYRLNLMRKSKTLAKQHGGAVLIVDANGKTRMVTAHAP